MLSMTRTKPRCDGETLEWEPEIVYTRCEPEPCTECIHDCGVVNWWCKQCEEDPLFRGHEKDLAEPDEHAPLKSTGYTDMLAEKCGWCGTSSTDRMMVHLTEFIMRSSPLLQHIRG